jgi:amidase
MTEIHEMTALEQGRAISAGEVSPAEVVTHYLRRIRALDGEIGAFVTVTEELALEQAEEVEAALAAARHDGNALGPLHGVPVAVKDVVHVENVRCTQGSVVYADEVSDIDDHVITKLKRAGLIILGTTNTPEFALPCYTENRLGPPTRNPWSRNHSPGGSSGGSAAAVASDLVPIAHGTDAGGSIRIPASACGVVGLKPSRGRVSDGPVAPDVTGLSVHGALARNAADAAALLDVMSGVMRGDVYTAPGADDRSSRLDKPARLRVVAMPEPMVPDVSVHPDCLAAVQKAAEELEAAGHVVEELEMSPDEGVAEAFAKTWAVHAAQIEVDEDDEDELMPFTRYMRERGRGVSGPEFYAALATFRGISQMLADMFFTSYDLILTPTLARPPALIGEFISASDQSTDYDRMSAFMPYTPLYNIAGLPAISLPLHWGDDGLPIGVMLGAGYGDEEKLVTVAAELGARVGLPRQPDAARSIDVTARSADSGHSE